MELRPAATMEVADSLPQYQHQSLKRLTSLRILVLYPANDFRAPIEGRIRQVDREELLEGWGEPGFYEAVSYYWGGSDMTHHLSVRFHLGYHKKRRHYAPLSTKQ